MKTVIMLLVVASFAFADHVEADASGHVVSVDGSPAGLFDAYGRYLSHVVDGNVVALATPEWGSNAGDRKKVLESAVEVVLVRKHRVELWQAVPALVAYRDRASELAEIDAELSALISILGGN